MSGYTVTHLHEIPRRDRWIPVRDHLDIGAFGVNAYHADNPGDTVISDHTESLSKHEELYVVVEGHATFTVDGGEVDAPAGTLVYVGDPATRRTAVAVEAGTTVVVAGARPGAAFEVSPWEETWEENQEAMKLYRELKPHFNVFFDDKGAVGRRYRRQDEAGTPFCITIDGQTLQDDTVTIRDRDTLKQERVPTSQVRAVIEKALTPGA